MQSFRLPEKFTVYYKAEIEHEINSSSNPFLAKTLLRFAKFRGDNKQSDFTIDDLPQSLVQDKEETENILQSFIFGSGGVLGFNEGSYYLSENGENFMPDGQLFFNYYMKGCKFKPAKVIRVVNDLEKDYDFFYSPNSHSSEMPLPFPSGPMRTVVLDAVINKLIGSYLAVTGKRKSRGEKLRGVSPDMFFCFCKHLRDDKLYYLDVADPYDVGFCGDDKQRVMKFFELPLNVQKKYVLDAEHLFAFLKLYADEGA